MEGRVLPRPAARPRGADRFGRAFGDVTPGHPYEGDVAPAELPEIHTVSPQAYDARYGRNYRAREGVNGPGWHADVTPLINPPSHSILRAEVVPAYGGDTQFTNVAAAYAGLSPIVRSFIDELRAEHRFGATRSAVPRRNERIADWVREKPLASIHPVVRVHPESGERVLYVNPSFTTEIVDLSPTREPPRARPAVRRAGPPRVHGALQVGARRRSPSGTTAPRCTSRRATSTTSPATASCTASRSSATCRSASTGARRAPRGRALPGCVMTSSIETRHRRRPHAARSATPSGRTAPARRPDPRRPRDPSPAPSDPAVGAAAASGRCSSSSPGSWRRRPGSSTPTRSRRPASVLRRGSRADRRPASCRRTLIVSLGRVVKGLALGISVGTVLAVLAGLSRGGENVIDTNMEVVRAIPALRAGADPHRLVRDRRGAEGRADRRHRHGGDLHQHLRRHPQRRRRTRRGGPHVRGAQLGARPPSRAARRPAGLPRRPAPGADRRLAGADLRRVGRTRRAVSGG